MEASTTAHPAANQQIALRRWRGLIAAQIAYFEHLVAAHQEEAERGILPQGELDWLQKEIRGWGRHLSDIDGRLAAGEGDGNH